MNAQRTAIGVACLLADVPILAFLAQADYDAIGKHPARGIVALIVVAIAVALLVTAVRMLRSVRRP